MIICFGRPRTLSHDAIINDLKTITTAQGSDLVVDSDGTSAYVDDAKILTYDVEVDNGRFHIIDWVNYPKKK
jgi:uncharacterized surface protein with fasciclin (FAS1) repeats